MPLVFETLKTSKKDFHHSEHKKRKDKICPFSILAFLQSTTVDKEPKKDTHLSILVNKSIGKTGFEPATPWSQTKYSTKLSYFPS